MSLVGKGGKGGNDGVSEGRACIKQEGGMRIFEQLHTTQAWSCWHLRLRAAGCHGDVVKLVFCEDSLYSLPLQPHWNNAGVSGPSHRLSPLPRTCSHSAIHKVCSVLPSFKTFPNTTSSEKSILTTPPKITTPTRAPPPPPLYFYCSPLLPLPSNQDVIPET